MEFTKRYDAVNNRLYVEDEHFVAHCHHYHSLLHRQITSIPIVDGKQIYYEAARDDTIDSLKRFFTKRSISDPQHKVSAAAAFYKYQGFGMLDFTHLSQTGGMVISPVSYMGIAYMNKFGKQSKPIDDYARGYIAAVCITAYGIVKDAVSVHQTRCLSCGDEYAEFKVEVR